VEEKYDLQYEGDLRVCYERNYCPHSVWAPVTSGCGWRGWRIAANVLKSSHGQPTTGAPPVSGFGEGVNS
jgi:hypothetical protein